MRTAGRPWLLFATGVAVRLAAIWSTRASGVFSDMLEYHDRAVVLLQQGLFQGIYAFDAWRTPVFPLFLWGHYSVFDVGFLAPRVGQAVVAGASTVLTYLLAREMVGERRAWAAALAVAFYPSSILFSIYLASETLFTFLLLAGLWAWLTRRGLARCALAGVCLGAATLTRAAGLIGLVGIAASLIPLWRRDRALLVRQLAVTGLAFALTLAPWIARNHAVYGRVIPLDTNGGFNFLAGNHPEATGRFEWDFSRTLMLRYYPDATTDIEIASLGYQHGLAYVVANPLRSVVLAGAKLGYLWGLEGREHVWLYSQGYFGPRGPTTLRAWGWAILIAFPVLAVLAVAGLLKPGLSGSPVGCAMVGALIGLSLLHAVSFGEARFHLPVVPLLAILAARSTERGGDPVAWSAPRKAAAFLLLASLAYVWYTQAPLLLERLSLMIQGGATPPPLVY